MKHLIRFTLMLLAGFGSATGLLGANPQSDAVYMSYTNEYTLQKDGRIDFRHSSVVKILTHRAFHNMVGESFVVYNPASQTLKIDRSVTTMADGKKVSSPQNAFNEVLPRWAVNSAIHNHLREMVVSHTALEVGASIDFAYTISSRPGYYPFLMGQEIAALHSPVESYKVVVRVPEGVSLHHKMLNLRLGPEISVAKGYTVYTWNFGALPAMPKDSHLPAETAFLPTLSFTAPANGNDPLAWLVSQPAFKAQNLPSTALQAIEKTSALPEVLSRVLQIRDLVVNDIATIGVKPQFTGFLFRTPAEVWDALAGTEAEKALLLSLLLQKAGITSAVVAALPTALYEKGFFNYYNIDGWYVKAELPGGPTFYLSPLRQANQDQWPALYGKTLVQLLPEAGLGYKQEVFPENNEFRADGDFVLADNMELSGNIKLKVTSLFNPFFDLFADRAAIKNLIAGGISAANVSSFDVKRSNIKRSEAELVVSVEKGLKEIPGGLYAWEIPYAREGVESWNAQILPGLRDAPFAIPRFLLESCEFTIRLPANLELVTPEIRLEFKKEFGSMQIWIRQDGDKVKVKRAIDFVEKDISLMKYSELREMLVAWYSPQYKTLYFKAK